MAFDVAKFKASGGEVFFGRSFDVVMVREDLISQHIHRQIVALKRIVAFLTTGKDMSSLYNDVAHLTSSSNTTIKRLVYLYLIHSSRSQPEKAVLQAGAFVRDTLNDSALIRGAALRTMTAMLVPAMVDFVTPPARRCLADSDPSVRRIAAFAVLKIFSLAPNVCLKSGLVDELEGQLGDSVPMVIAGATTALLEIYQRSRSSAIEDALVRNSSNLLLALGETYDWSKHYLLEGIAVQFTSRLAEEYRRHHPRHPRRTRAQLQLSLEDSERTLSGVLPCLLSANSAVAFSAAKVMIGFLLCFTGSSSPLSAAQKTELEAHVAPRIIGPFISFLGTARAEVRYVILKCIRLFQLTQLKPYCLPHLSSFFIKYDDPIYVKLEKVEVLVAMVDAESGARILSELIIYSAESDMELARKSVRCIGQLAVAVEPIAEMCVQRLAELLQTRVSHIAQEACLVVQTILRQYSRRFIHLVAILRNTLSVVESEEAKAAVVWIMGEHIDRAESALDTLELFLATFPNETLCVQLAVLSSCVKVYLKCHKGDGNCDEARAMELLESVLSKSRSSGLPALCDRALFYWRLISADLAAAKTYVLAPMAEIQDMKQMDCDSISELVVQIATLASVVQRSSGYNAFHGMGQWGDDDAQAAEGGENGESDDDSTVAGETSDGDSEAPGVGGVAAQLLSYPFSGDRASPRGRNADDGSPRSVHVDPTAPTSPRAEDSVSYASGGGAGRDAATSVLEEPVTKERASELTRYVTVLDRLPGNGVEVQMMWGQSGTRPVLRCRIHLHNEEAFVSQSRISALQLNGNIFGLGLSQGFPYLSLDAGKNVAQVNLEVHCNNVKTSTREIQVAMQIEPVGVRYFLAPPIPPLFLLLPATGLDTADFMATYRAISVPSWTMPPPEAPMLTEASRYTANYLRMHNISLVHTKDVIDAKGRAKLGLLLFAETIARQKLIFELVVSQGEILLLIVRSTDHAVASVFGEYALSFLSVR